MAKKKDGLLPVIIAMAVLLVVSIGFLAGYNAWVNRELTPEEDAAQIAGTYDGGTITKGEFMERYENTALLYTYQYGTTEGYESEILNQAAYDVMTEKLLPLKAAELGLDEITEEERAELEAAAQERYDSSIDSYISGYLTEEQQALSEEEQRQAAIDEMAAEGVTLDALYEQQVLSLYAQRVQDAVTVDVAVTDEEIHTAYEEQLATDQTTYDDAWYYAYVAQYGQYGLWAPEGVRIVKHILVIPDAEYTDAYTTAAEALATALDSIETLEADIAGLQAEINGTGDAEPAEGEEAAATAAPTATPDPEATPEPAPEEQLAAKQAELDELNASLPGLREAVEETRVNAFASQQEKLDEIYARIEAGEDFEALIAEYGEDPGMQEGIGLSTGYYVAADSINWLAEFTDASMELEAIGDVSEPILSQSGIHIIRYMADVTPGATSEEDARDTLAETLLTTKKNEEYQANIEQWISDYNFTLYSDVLGL